ncbi:MAG TPA: TfoX/Sxy family protein [Polyangiaceae bacterium]|nr:TfoX/Sxy family protein [Polyangiaceae bacterium]HMR76732.1 TfoX/Sxy family protein [Polyangiaceae bacterium]
MAFDEKVRARLAAALKGKKGIVEKRMFGGVAFMHHGNMALGVQDKDLMVKVGAENYAAALKRPHARPMDFTGRPLKGYVYVAAPGFKTKQALDSWVASGIAGAASAKPKTSPKNAAGKPGAVKTAEKTPVRTRKAVANRPSTETAAKTKAKTKARTKPTTRSSKQPSRSRATRAKR